MTKTRIVVIDDELEIRSVVTEYLQAIGYDVFEAASGIEALSLFEPTEKPVDIALVDWNLPGISGRDVIKAIESRSPETVVVVTTGDSPESMNHRREAENWADVVHKPFGLRQLRDRLATALQFADIDPTGP